MKFMSPASADWRWLASMVLILASTVGLNLLSHGTPPLRSKQLASFPTLVESWNGQDVPIEDYVQDILGATDVLNRVYFNPTIGSPIGMFVAYFEAQRRGGAIHSPKNCLPGAGWNVVRGDRVPILFPGYSQPVQVNRYIVQKGTDKQVVLYWYQSQGRIIASEYTAKICLVWDAMTRNRTDGALVRITVPVGREDEDAAFGTAKAFVEQVIPRLKSYIPS